MVLCKDFVPKQLYQKPGLYFMPYEVMIRVRNGRADGMWGVSAEKNMNSKNHSHSSLSLCVSLSFSHTHSHKFKMHTSEHSCTISRISDTKVPDMPPVFSVLVSRVIHSSSVINQTEIMQSRWLIMNRLVGLVIRKRHTQKAKSIKLLYVRA